MREFASSGDVPSKGRAENIARNANPSLADELGRLCSDHARCREILGSFVAFNISEKPSVQDGDLSSDWSCFESVIRQASQAGKRSRKAVLEIAGPWIQFRPSRGTYWP